MIINNHIDAKDLNKDKMLVLEIIIKVIKIIKSRPDMIKEVDHTLNWKKMVTINKTIKNNLFRGSTL